MWNPSTNSYLYDDQEDQRFTPLPYIQNSTPVYRPPVMPKYPVRRIPEYQYGYYSTMTPYMGYGGGGVGYGAPPCASDQTYLYWGETQMSMARPKPGRTPRSKFTLPDSTGPSRVPYYDDYMTSNVAPFPPDPRVNLGTPRESGYWVPPQSGPSGGYKNT